MKVLICFKIPRQNNENHEKIIITHQNFHPIYDPAWSVGHPRLRWDDHIHSFCLKVWPQYRGCHWFNILSQYRGLNLEDEYVAHIAGM